MLPVKENIISIKILKWLPALIACFVLQSCAESIFDLSDESPKPKWFNTNIEADDKNVKIVLSYYLPNRAKVQLISKNSSGEKVIEELYGTYEEIVKKEGEDYYPHYEKVMVNGVVEIVLHKRMEPIFYISTLNQ